jgi:phage-related baseplate assembly protein
MINIDTLINPITADQAEASIIARAKTIGLDISNWKSDSVVRVIVRAVSESIALLSTTCTTIAQMSMLSTSEGDSLTILASEVYGLERIEATVASGTVLLTNSGGGIYAIDPGDCTIKNADGVTYSNLEAINLGASSSVSAEFACTQVGSVGTSAVGTITDMVTTFLGVSCENTDTFIGADTETDDALEARCRAQFASLSTYGPSEAYLNAAKETTIAGANIGVTRVKASRTSALHVRVVAAKESGGLTSPELSALELQLAGETPIGIIVDVASATTVAVPVTYQVCVSEAGSAYSESTIKNAIALAIGEYMAQVDIGGDLRPGETTGYVFRDELPGVILGAHPHLFGVTVSVPAGNTSLTSEQIPILGTVTGTLVR